MLSVLDLHSRDDVRRLIHSVAPGIATALVTGGILDANVAMLGAAVVLAAFNDTLAHINSPDAFRKWFYPVLTSITTLLIVTGIVTNEQVTPWLAIVTILIGGGMSAKNTPPPALASTPAPAHAAPAVSTDNSLLVHNAPPVVVPAPATTSPSTPGTAGLPPKTST
jgi:membrane-bound metal-dependent hydrolase YbcI (DUF457 family)